MGYFKPTGVALERLTEVCPLCGERHPSSQLFPINDEGTRACQRCIFIAALYVVKGIKKKCFHGCFTQNRLNSEFRNILKYEYQANPKAAYEKYLCSMLKEDLVDKIMISAEDYRKLDEFPFVFITDDEASTLKLQQGKKIRVCTDGDQSVDRVVYSFTHFGKKAARKYGHQAGTVCYVIKEEEAV